jgi:hypothetical protein
MNKQGSYAIPNIQELFPNYFFISPVPLGPLPYGQSTGQTRLYMDKQRSYVIPDIQVLFPNYNVIE